MIVVLRGHGGVLFFWLCTRRQAAGAVARSSNCLGRNLLAFELTSFFVPRLLRSLSRLNRTVRIIHKLELLKFALPSFHSSGFCSSALT